MRLASPAKAHSEGQLEEKLTLDTHLFSQLVSRCYERGSMLLASNRGVGEWGEVIGDSVAATAILDRLEHHSHIITIRGDSYRLREKKRSGHDKPPVAEKQT